MDSEGISNTHLPRHGRKSFRNECPGGIAAAWQINPSRHNLNITMTSLDAGNSPVKLICFFGTYIGIFKWSNYERAICVFFVCVHGCRMLSGGFPTFLSCIFLHMFPSSSQHFRATQELKYSLPTNPSTTLQQVRAAVQWLKSQGGPAWPWWFDQERNGMVPQVVS